jgi:Na+/H+-translocating membrane pyrophosphatase
VTRLNASTGKKAHVDLLEPLTFAGLLLGSMLPYWFSAMTMKSVGQAANAMVLEIKRQFDRNPNLLIPNHPDRPDYDTCACLHPSPPPSRTPSNEYQPSSCMPPSHLAPTCPALRCIKISTDASLREMVAPGCLVMLSPIVVGVLFGTQCVTGLLAGAISSGVQMAISASNTGGAWDNAKKYISKGSMDSMIAREEPDMVVGGKVNTKKSQIFKAAVTGDTVGDPLKDTSGPALNILMKLMAIISVVFADFFLSINDGGGLISYYV